MNIMQNVNLNQLTDLEINVFTWILEFLSFITWPLIYIASKALTNDFIYWSIFWVDKYFYSIRNIVRTFSNFILVFLILSWIFYYLIKKDKVQPSNLLKNVIIVSILINLSWFIIWALLDISTILTISLSSLTFKLASNNTNHNILLPYFVLYPWSEQNLSWTTKFWFYTDKKGNVYSQCPLDWWIFSWWIHKQNVLASSWFVKISSDKCVVNISWKPLVYNINNLDWKTYDAVFKIQPESVEWYTYNVNDLVKKDFFLWPLEYLYFNIFNFWWISDIWTQDNKNIAMIILIKTILVISLLIPLFVFALIMIVRAFYLWIIILFSPLIFIFWVFKIKIFKNFDKYTISSVLSLIFLPVIAVFSLSIGIIFFDLITLSSKSNSLWQINKCDWINWINYEFNIWLNQKVNICIKEAWNYSFTFDIIWWFFKILLGIIILRNTVFFSLKTSKLISYFVDPLEQFSKWLLKAAPIVPMPTWFTWIWSLQTTLSQVKKIPSSVEKSQAYDIINKIFNKKN